jgi:hypothetical protein
MSHKLKYKFSVESKSFKVNELENIKWDDLHYPPNVTDEERSEIDKLVDEHLRHQQVAAGQFTFSGTYDFILGQENVDRQVRSIKESGLRVGLIWHVKVDRIGFSGLVRGV